MKKTIGLLMMALTFSSSLVYAKEAVPAAAEGRRLSLIIPQIQYDPGKAVTGDRYGAIALHLRLEGEGEPPPLNKLTVQINGEQASYRTLKLSNSWVDNKRRRQSADITVSPNSPGLTKIEISFQEVKVTRTIQYQPALGKIDLLLPVSADRMIVRRTGGLHCITEELDGLTIFKDDSDTLTFTGLGFDARTVKVKINAKAVPKGRCDVTLDGLKLTVTLKKALSEGANRIVLTAKDHRKKKVTFTRTVNCYPQNVLPVGAKLLVLIAAKPFSRNDREPRVRLIGKGISVARPCTWHGRNGKEDWNRMKRPGDGVYGTSWMGMTDEYYFLEAKVVKAGKAKIEIIDRGTGRERPETVRTIELQVR